MRGNIQQADAHVSYCPLSEGRGLQGKLAPGHRAKRSALARDLKELSTGEPAKEQCHACAEWLMEPRTHLPARKQFATASLPLPNFVLSALVGGAHSAKILQGREDGRYLIESTYH